MQNTKTREEKLIEELISLYGSSNLQLVDKITGEVMELPEYKLNLYYFIITLNKSMLSYLTQQHHQ